MFQGGYHVRYYNSNLCGPPGLTYFIPQQSGQGFYRKISWKPGTVGVVVEPFVSCPPCIFLMCHLMETCGGVYTGHIGWQQSWTYDLYMYYGDTCNLRMEIYIYIYFFGHLIKYIIYLIHKIYLGHFFAPEP